MTDMLPSEVWAYALTGLGGTLALLGQYLRERCASRKRPMRHLERVARVERDLNRLARNLPPGRCLLLTAKDSLDSTSIFMDSWDEVQVKLADCPNQNPEVLPRESE